MSIALELSRIQTDRNTIRAKLVELGMATGTANLDALATAIDGIINQGAVSVTVQEGETYTIPKGYHNGSGTVSGVAGGGNYNLQSKTATPTKKQQNVTPDAGYYGLSDVTVAPIPDAYQDVSSTTAAASDVLTGKVYVLADGTVTTGTMPNNGTVSKFQLSPLREGRPHKVTVNAVIFCTVYGINPVYPCKCRRIQISKQRHCIISCKLLRRSPGVLCMGKICAKT